MIARPVTAALVMAVSISGAWAAGTRQDDFPHEEHEGVFPLCTGCHVGMESGIEAEEFPEPENCTTCHDGTTEELVDWEGRSPRASNLVYDHPEHVREAEAAGDSIACAACHQQAGREERMAVERADPERCVTCHAHEAPEHLAAGADCASCHLELVAATELPPERIDSFPQPPDHEQDAFLTTHGDAPAPQTCVVCHAQESCQRCHLNALAVPEITELGHDPRVAALARERPAEYPTPATHESNDWLWAHAGDSEAEDNGCANCHAVPSCRSCHQDGAVPAIDALPEPEPDGPAGVVFEDGPPEVHPAGFSSAHAAVAAAAAETCTSCHAEESFCLDCHDGSAQPEFHMPNFRERHGALAYGGEAECSSCHNPELFCRDCHAGSGLASRGQLDVAFHTAEPFWLLDHGQAARQRLESCATCHAQTDCVQCHSSVGAWRINPHGPGFDAERAETRNRFQCLRCHRN